MQVGALTSAEKGATVRVKVCFNVVESHTPPMFIFPKVRMNPELIKDYPPKACHPPGWMQTDVFIK